MFSAAFAMTMRRPNKQWRNLETNTAAEAAPTDFRIHHGSSNAPEAV
jgi:hypothetical protein